MNRQHFNIQLSISHPFSNIGAVYNIQNDQINNHQSEKNGHMLQERFVRDLLTTLRYILGLNGRDADLYSWVGRPIRADKKIIYQQTRRVTTLLRPLLKSSRR